VTDGMSDARYPDFDRDGQYLYFTASTNYGTTVSGLDMSSDEFEVTRSVYALVLSNEAASPVAPESDEEKAGGAPRPPRGGPPEPAPVKPVRVDLGDMQRRIVALPVPARAYDNLIAGKAGTFYLVESPSGFSRAAAAGRTLQRFDLKSRKLEPIASNISSFDLSSDGEKMLVSYAPAGEGGPGRGAGANRAPQFAIVSATAPAKPGEGMLRLAGMEVKVDPAAEWKQMYHEAWRVERSYFYDPHFHGVDIANAEKKYEPYLDSLASRADLNYIFQEMLGEFTVGHMRGGGGHIPNERNIPGGLLGADYEVANGRYRFKKIYSGESWNPQLRSPLVQPGIKAAVGDYILSINGQNLTDQDDISRLLENTANKTVVLKLASDAAGANAHEVSVVPVATEQPLRNLAWIEENRRKVDELSGGKLAYVYMPDTAMGGLTSFNRYFFAQTDRKGVVLDERFNSGGQVADYVIEVLKRPLLSYWAPRYGDIYKTPAGSIQGPRVMIINEFAGSGGDAMPWLFHNQQIGTLVGKRTWGGLVGVGQYPVLMDGGNVTAPSFGFFSPKGEWDVENHGVAPDVEVELDPRLVAQGKDPQLEKAVSIAMEQLQKSAPPEPKRPAYPNYHPVSKGPSKDVVKGTNE
jgi:tricorn protease